MLSCSEISSLSFNSTYFLDELSYANRSVFYLLNYYTDAAEDLVLFPDSMKESDARDPALIKSEL